jgi:hypothetical protein
MTTCQSGAAPATLRSSTDTIDLTSSLVIKLPHAALAAAMSFVDFASNAKSWERSYNNDSFCWLTGWRRRLLVVLVGVLVVLWFWCPNGVAEGRKCARCVMSCLDAHSTSRSRTRGLDPVHAKVGLVLRCVSKYCPGQSVSACGPTHVALRLGMLRLAHTGL